MTTEKNNIEPPKGMRWREVVHPFAHGAFWRYTDRLQIKYDDNTYGWRDVSMLNVCPVQIAVIHDLMQNNTEPDPDYREPEPVERDAVWHTVYGIIHKTWFQHIRTHLDDATDAIMRLTRGRRGDLPVDAAIAHFAHNLESRQQPLNADAQRILSENLFDLYDDNSTEPSTPRAKAPDVK